jgi:N-acyl-D-aspartate/D-glutamate deacylase
VRARALRAQRMRLADCAWLKQGMSAGIVVLNPDTVRDPATFEIRTSVPKACGMCC